ncbi:precorrin-6A reductase [Polycladidibacter hongkongensis]|uniref:precorrin-6A reductase n=1 Tax=Polycladidibacter hongkongensis TaxID=1647556 RepID=UPI0008348EDF|nr:precorrin-6A reductase [Pseudovibrio hongkongensis]
MSKKLLVLGGTKEARELIDRLALCDNVETTASLAGATKAPLPLAVTARSGGFGGVVGLKKYLQEHQITTLIDATHPFATQITANARHACEASDVEYLRLTRPPWQPSNADTWYQFADLSQAIAALPAGARVFSAIGSKEAARLSSRPDVFWVVRALDAELEAKVSDTCQVIIEKPRTRVEDEIHLLRSLRVDAVLAKNSGGSAGYNKIAAARHLSLPLYLVDQPKNTAPTERVFHSLDQLLEMIR